MQLAAVPYCFAPHVHVCRSGRDVVMLDLKRDRYFGIDPADAAALASLVDGFPAVARETSDQISSPEDRPLLNELLAEGAVIANRQDVRSAVRTTLPRPEIALINGYVDNQPRPTIRDLMHVLSSVTTAAALMRWCSMQRIVGHVRSVAQRAGSSSFDADLARQRVAVYTRVRPFLYASSEACLFSSLAIQSFLAHVSMAPQFVFGVTTRPFRAHCWLQSGHIVVNDVPEHVREYTPILVI